MVNFPAKAATRLVALSLGMLLSLHGEEGKEGAEGKTSVELLKQLASGEAGERRKAEEAIVAHRRVLCKSLIDMIKPGSRGRLEKESRTAAARILGEMRYEEAAPFLVAGTGEPHEPFLLKAGVTNVPTMCEYALKRIGRPAVPSLIKAIQESDKVQVRRSCLCVLNSILGGKRRVTELLGKLAAKAPGGQVKSNLAAAEKYVEGWQEGEEPLY